MKAGKLPLTRQEDSICRPNRIFLNIMEATYYSPQRPFYKIFVGKSADPGNIFKTSLKFI